MIHLAGGDFLYFREAGFPLSDGTIYVLFSLLNRLSVDFHINTETVSSSIQKFEFCFADDSIKLRRKSFSVLALAFDALNPKARRYRAVGCMFFKKLDSQLAKRLEWDFSMSRRSRTFFLRIASIVESSLDGLPFGSEAGSSLLGRRRLNQRC